MDPEKLAELFKWLNANSDSWRMEHQKEPIDRFMLTVYPHGITEFLTVYNFDVIGAFEDMRHQLEAHHRWKSTQKQGCTEPPPF